MEWNMSANRYMRWYRGTHGVHIIYWEERRAYGGGRGGFIVASGSGVIFSWWTAENGLVSKASIRGRRHALRYGDPYIR